MLRMRLSYTKTKEASYILSEDMMYVLDRALTRIGVYVEYDKDQSPSVIIASSLPQGIDSTEEMCDVYISEYMDPTFVVKGINNFLPKGIVVLSAEYVEDNVPLISEQVYASVTCATAHDVAALGNVFYKENAMLKQVRTSGIADPGTSTLCSWIAGTNRTVLPTSSVTLQINGSTVSVK